VCLSLNISTAAKKVDLSIENYYIGYWVHLYFENIAISKWQSTCLSF
jgi:hypothetical protein